MVGSISEAKSSVSGVTDPYCRTEHCGKIHPYRCDKEVGVLGIDVSKDNLITSRRGKYENNLNSTSIFKVCLCRSIYAS